ncbi:MAG TPA: sigma-70 family RNA polymerase sigma factor [Polyangiaceae bacterium LLY-WYZ-15_(1-7)]|nr:sigma-70 family RNA polymerase sigma factor [Polyangiaceae bacterium LLY-WYZ-15_(1-7)]HJL09132.1 sigma-70 family RNA polymerase sigma factor [Polyangiaceae bacterium LLY-WYZ-15_(1-7)]HJL21910.1 sigma-70 family RNA polymerase sigma factor [Polyangiaceae bacterium LLY-WYZ-15_(1-7)]HJL38293.1 sigma-70 family RNA polymerase sigma factor [Polyangiaceae bacterium LLY-WYZ-15_(1-7)]HJL48441.1 sigma-70 family RNA polymerase sigma factor [Polyangiaceae bacterium LLY-WYZ-15_(1-7)]
MPEPTTHPDAPLLRALREGDVRAAAEGLVRRYADEVHALCRAMVRDATAAEDLAQDVFGRAFAALPAFRAEASLRTWILRIARNRCVDHLRARQREPWGPGAEEEPDAQPAAEPSVAQLLVHREQLRAGLDALSEGERALVVLRFGHELGYPELADAFGLKEGAVRMRVSRAVAKMRAVLETPGAGAMRSRSAGAPPAPAAPRRPSAPRASGARPPEARPEAPPGAPAPGAPPARAPAPGLARGGARRRLGAAPPAPPSPFALPASDALRARLHDLLDALSPT